MKLRMPTVSIDNATRVLKVANIFRYFLMIMPVIVLVYKDKGITTGDFFLIQGIFSFTVFLLEVPTGYIGDLFSRKKVMVISSLITFLAHTYLLATDGFINIMIVEMFWGLAAALMSGTMSAYLYDILEKQKKENIVMKEEGALASSKMMSTSIATFSGGVIYNYFGANVLIIITSILMFISCILFSILPDIKDNKRVMEKVKQEIL
ncbi:MAG: MFS transporter [Alphaproteobacteria bacterium]|jgi:MFS family permease|nr:MFS transporter [Alphaproteobacteria bacterium]